MSINNNTLDADEEITHTKYNQTVADANNSTNNIHPQYFHHYDALGFEVGVLKDGSTIKRYRADIGYRVAADWPEAALYSQDNLRRHTFKKLPDFLHTDLRIKCKMLKVENSSSVNTFAGYVYVYSGNNVTPIYPVPETGAYTLTTTVQAVDATIDISAIADNTIITIDLLLRNSVYSAPADSGDYEKGQMYEIEIYTE